MEFEKIVAIEYVNMSGVREETPLRYDWFGKKHLGGIAGTPTSKTSIASEVFLAKPAMPQSCFFLNQQFL